jgi:hypothetical protein
LGVALLLVFGGPGCAGPVRLYPSHSDEGATVEETLGRVPPGTKLIVRTDAESRLTGRFRGVASEPEATLLLGGGNAAPGTDSAAVAIPLRQIAYLAEDRRGVKAGAVLFCIFFGILVALVYNTSPGSWGPS